MKSLIWIGLLALTTGCSGPSKSELDAEVKRLCAIDGGIKVYETVKLPAERFDEHGNVKIPEKSLATPEDEYYYERETRYYKQGNPELSSSRHKIIRRKDNKVLGEAIRYARGGGDFPGPWHDSTFICPDPKSRPGLEESIFLRGDNK